MFPVRVPLPKRALPIATFLLGVGLGLAQSSMLSGCGSSTISRCHEMRKCVTLTCRDRLKKGTNAEIWRECVEYCRKSRGAGIGEPVRCAEKTGVICIRDWYGEACVDARERCETGRFLPDGGC